jgi:PPOX class probable F420-dependent enzyme
MTTRTAVEIPAEARRLIESRNFGAVATVNPDGSPQVTPVWVDYEDGDVLFNTAEGRVKAENLREDRQVAVTVTNQDNPYENVAIQGEAELVRDGADEHIDRLAKKYLGKETYPFREPGEERVIVRIKPQRVAYTAPH